MLATILCLALGATEPDAGTPVWRTLPAAPAMPAPERSGTLEVDGASLWWSAYGPRDGAPVVLLHGGAGNSDHWAGQVPALAQRHRVYVIDSRGHGRSTKDSKPLSYARMASDVLKVMDALEVSRAAVIGWSDGGAVGLELAVRAPERLTALVAYATNYDLTGMKPGGGPAFAAYFQRCAADYERLSPTPKRYQNLLEALRPMWRTQPNFTEAQLRAIPVRTLVLDGDHDEIIKVEHVKRLAEFVPHARLQLLENASHFALFQQPNAFNAAVLDFLDDR